LFNLIVNSILFGIFVLILIAIYGNINGENVDCSLVLCDQPIINNPDLKVQLIYQGNFTFEPNNLSPVSSMTFLGPNDILLLDKNNGLVYRIVNNSLIDEPLLDVNVANKKERGLLGIQVAPSVNNHTYVYLYYTESEKGDGNDSCPTKFYSVEFHCVPDSEPLGNRLYKYELEENKLLNPELLLDLPAAPSPTHNGGVIKIGPDNNLYFTIGDLLGGTNPATKTKTQNLNGSNIDGRSGILRLTQAGKPVGTGILGDSTPLRLYYAYGIRNSFGIDFDPITGKLWDTENGPEYGDEINLVDPGFNSGYERVQGMWQPKVDTSPNGRGLIAGNLFSNMKALVNFDGKGHYSTPEFTWNHTVAPTAIIFLKSDALGAEYENDIFVGSMSGKLFHFELNENRTDLKLPESLTDKIAYNNDDNKDLIFADEMGGITDMDVGPDGYLYILSNYKNKATIFRVSPIGT